MGLGNTTNFSTGRTLSFAVSYANGPFKAAAAYSNEHDRTPSIVTTGITTFQGVPSATYVADKLQNMGAGASYQFGKLLVHGLYTRVKLESAGHSDTSRATTRARIISSRRSIQWLAAPRPRRWQDIAGRSS